jgi:hypothetical protein
MGSHAFAEPMTHGPGGHLELSESPVSFCLVPGTSISSQEEKGPSTTHLTPVLGLTFNEN